MSEQFDGGQHGVGELMAGYTQAELDQLATASAEPVLISELAKEVNLIVSTENVGLPAGGDYVDLSHVDVESVFEMFEGGSDAWMLGWEPVDLVTSAPVIQVADVLSCASVPEFWALHIRYVNDEKDSVVRVIRVGTQPVNPGDYRLWASKRNFIEARFDDYSGIVLVPCPDVVSI